MVTTQKEREAFAARLNLALDRAGVPPKGKGRQDAVAERYGVSQKGARKWLEGEACPVMARLTQIARDLKISSEWLLTGRGAMIESTDVRQEDGIKEPSKGYAISPRGLMAAEIFDALTTRQQDEVFSFLTEKKRSNEEIMSELSSRQKAS